MEKVQKPDGVQVSRQSGIKANKRMIPVFVYRYLSENSSVNNPVTQKEILEHVNDELEKQGLRDDEKPIDRKTIGRTIMDFAELGWVKAPERKKDWVRRHETGEHFRTGVYMDSGFTDTELTVMMTPMLMGSYLSDEGVQKLLRKVRKLNRQSGSELGGGSLAIQHENGADLLSNIGTIFKAVKEKKRLSFIYNDVDESRRLVKRVKADYPDGVRKVNPYGVVSDRGFFYFICSHEDCQQLFTYRIDKMTAVYLDTKEADSISRVPGYENWQKFRPMEYLSRNYKMWGGECCDVSFRVMPDDFGSLNYYINTVWDEFGKRVEWIVVDKDKKSFEFQVKVSAGGAKLFALQYASVAELLYPKSLRQEVQEILQKTLKRYR